MDRHLKHIFHLDIDPSPSMDDMYCCGLQSDDPHDLNPAEDLHGLIAAAGIDRRRRRRMTSESASTRSRYDEGEEAEEVLKTRIASHPLYPTLLQAYIDCQKVGAPPEIASFLDEILQSNDAANNNISRSDPELDDFMEVYCDVLAKYRSDLARPFDEATSFLNGIETQLADLCTTNNNNNLVPSSISPADEAAAGSSEEEVSGGENEKQESHDGHLKGESKDIKDMLLRKYSGCLSSLKQEFSKKKKKGKLPKEARQMLLQWWNAHYKWPYPTEADKIALADSTGLDQKQINNWFINQRKRHWKPSESMQFAVMGNLSTSFYDD